MDQEVSQVTAAAVSFHYVEGQLLVALVSRSSGHPQPWHLPGANVFGQHTSLQCLEYTLRTRCGMTPRNVRYREQLYTFETPSSDNPSKNAFILAYIYLSSELLWHKGSDHIGVFPINKLPKLTPLTKQIIDYAIERLRSKSLYTTLPGFLLPPAFTLDQYQQVFETLTGKTVDRRNFRKKIHALDIVTPASSSDTKKKTTTQYTLTENHLSILKKSF